GAEPTEAPRIASLRSALTTSAALAANTDASSRTEGASALAQKLLAMDPASPPLREVAASLTTAAGPQFDRAALALAAMLRNELPDAPAVGNLSTNGLKGAVADALERAKTGAIKR